MIKQKLIFAGTERGKLIALRQSFAEVCVIFHSQFLSPGFHALCCFRTGMYWPCQTSRLQPNACPHISSKTKPYVVLPVAINWLLAKYLKRWTAHLSLLKRSLGVCFETYCCCIVFNCSLWILRYWSLFKAKRGQKSSTGSWYMTTLELM